MPVHEFRVLTALADAAQLDVAALVVLVGFDQSLVMAAVKSLSDKGLVVVAESEYEELSLSEQGRDAARRGFPERRALEAVSAAGGSIALSGLSRALGEDDVRTHVKWLSRKRWCFRDATALVITEEGRKALSERGPDELVVAELERIGPAPSSTLSSVAAAGLGMLAGRSDLVRRRRRVTRLVSLTQKGKELVAKGVSPAEGVSQLSPELLASGRWREVVLKRYDIRLAAAPRYPGKTHPLQRVIQETRRAFFEMGFEEAESPVVETAFWDFDALFQPQDHPAREMQDTFYMKTPARGELPDPDLVARVAQTHENGGETGSIGWRYQWSAEKARQLVLRTHTTAATIRAVARNPQPPRKVFSIGKVFRRENVDPTHLPEFFQIDGIIVDDQANLATLLGTLSEFYRRMGAKDVRFRPSFFPYTEPSAEVFAFVEGLGWVEMCGSGVFRPEVTRPLGCTTPVIAWGGGLERVAMLRFGLDDIRKLYWADIDWLREAKLCR